MRLPCKKMWSAVHFTQAAYGPVQVIGWWDSACDEPLYLVTNLTDREDACHCYQKRMLIETLFSDQKSRGFRLEIWRKCINCASASNPCAG